MDATTLGQVAALGTALCWTVTSLSFEAAGKRVGSLQVNLIRLGIALPLFALVRLFTTGLILPTDADAHVWLWMSLSGLVGFVLGDLFLFQAFVDVGARVAMLVYSSVPPMTALFGRLILGERLTTIQGFAMALTVAGIMMVTLALPRRSVAAAGEVGATIDSAAARNLVVARPAPTHAHPVRGAWFALLGAVGQALGLVFGRYGAPTYDAVGATQIRAIAGFLGFALLFTVTRRWSRIAPAIRDSRAMGHVARGAFFGPFLGVTLGLVAAQRAGTGVASTIIATVPVLLIPVSVFVLHQRVTLREVIGAVVAVAGVALLFLA